MDNAVQDARAELERAAERRARYGWRTLRANGRFKGPHAAYKARWPLAVDAFEAAIRADERAKVEALVDAATEIANLPMLRGESGVGATYTVTYKDTGAMDRLEAALRALAGQSEEGTG